MIVTEAVINALKHAFPDAKPDSRIVVAYKLTASGWQLSIADNGVGKGDPLGAKPGLGTSIVKALAQQLEADVALVGDQAGTTLTVIRYNSAPP